jgi:hypothetical protein
MSGLADSHPGSSLRLLAAARTLAVDALTAEAIDALRAAGVRSILLKGPALAHWLYGDGALREYGDCDLLVDPADTDRAGAVLAELGFEPLVERTDPYMAAMAPPHAECWTRGEGHEQIVDLHHCLFGAHAPNETVWRELSAATEPVGLAGVTAEVLDAPRRALVVTLHAAANGSGGDRSLEDLRRALSLVDEAVWEEAARIASRIGARQSFAAGLGLLPDGRELADRLGLQPPASAEVLLHAGTVPEGAIFLEALRNAQSARERCWLLVRALVPSPRYMRALSPLARRGRIGLCAAYAVRIAKRIASARPALRAIRLARQGGS